MDTQAPKITPVDPPVDEDGEVAGNGFSDLSTITVQFDEPVISALTSGNLNKDNFSWTGGGASGTDPLDVVNVQPNANYTNGYDVISDGTPQGGDCILHADNVVDAASNPCTDTILYSGRKPKDIVLVLDYSGSMGDPSSVDPSLEKHEFLKDSVEKFLHVWCHGYTDSGGTEWSTGYAANGDKVSVVFFRSNAHIRQNLPINNALIPIMSDGDVNKDAVINDVNGEVVTGSTAMGAGLGKALEILDYRQAGPFARDRYIILFTDGRQNRRPFAHIEGNTIRIDIDNSFDWAANGFVEEYGQSSYAGDMGGNDMIIDNQSIPIYTLGIGLYDDYPVYSTILAQIANISGGISFIDTQVNTPEWPTIERMFIDVFQDIYSASSPQIVGRQQGEYSDDMLNSLEFALNRSAKRLTICLSWLGNRPLDFMLKKGEKIISIRDAIVDDRYKIASIIFPHSQPVRKILNVEGLSLAEMRLIAAFSMMYEIPMEAEAAVEVLPGAVSGVTAPVHTLWEHIEPAGSWEIIVNKAIPHHQDGIPYHLTVIADEKMLFLDYILSGKIFEVGKAIDLGVLINEAGFPIEFLHNAEAIVTRPNEALGNVLARYRIKAPSVDSKSDDGWSAMKECIRALMQNPKAAEDLKKTVKETVTLRPVSKNRALTRRSDQGLFRASYENTLVPGIYSIEFRIEGTGKKTGTFERTASRTVIVRTKLDKASSQLKGEYLEKKKLLKISCVLKDKFGNLLGPGYRHNLKGKLSGRIIKDITDTLDGSYSIIAKVSGIDELFKSKLEIQYESTVLFNNIPAKLIEEIPKRGGKKGKVK